MIDDMEVFRTTMSIAHVARPAELLGAFGLEGLNLRVDVARRELVPAGPIPAAGARAA